MGEGDNCSLTLTSGKPVPGRVLVFFFFFLIVEANYSKSPTSLSSSPILTPPPLLLYPHLPFLVGLGRFFDFGSVETRGNPRLSSEGQRMSTSPGRGRQL